MVDAVLAQSGKRRMVIKLHPCDPDPATRTWLRDLERQPGGPMITDANLHDSLAQAAVTVTINSAVGLESHVHHVPVILCGQADFHHAAVTVTAPGQMTAAIHQATTTEWPHDVCLHWYLEQDCLNAGKPTRINDFVAKVQAFGPYLTGLDAGGPK